MRTRHFFVFALLLTLGSCKSIKQGESWKMTPEDKTIGLTLLYELPEAKLKEMLPKDQQPRITNGKGVLMLFLASTDSYYIGKRKYGQLGIAHLLIPLQKNLSVAETIGEKSQAIISGLDQVGYQVRHGKVNLGQEEIGDKVKVTGSIQTKKGAISFAGTSENIKGKKVDLSETILVGKDESKNLLIGPEFYNPINFTQIEVNQSGVNWISQWGLNSPPKRIWVNVGFGVDFKFHKSTKKLNE